MKIRWSWEPSNPYIGNYDSDKISYIEIGCHFAKNKAVVQHKDGSLRCLLYDIKSSYIRNGHNHLFLTIENVRTKISYFCNITDLEIFSRILNTEIVIFLCLQNIVHVCSGPNTQYILIQMDTFNRPAQAYTCTHDINNIEYHKSSGN